MFHEPAALLAGSRWSSPALRGLLAIAIILMMKFAAQLLIPIAIAVVLTFVLSPVVRLLRRRRIPEPVGAAIVVTMLLAITLALAAMLVQPAMQWWERAPMTIAQLVDALDRLRESLPIGGSGGARRSAPAPDPIREQLATEGLALTRVVIGSTLSFGLSAVGTVILLYFLLASEHWMLSRSVEAIPRRRSRALLLSGVRSAQREIAHFVASLALVNLGVAFATMFAMMAIGLPNPVLWGAMAGILSFIPYLGPIAMFVLLGLAGVATFQTTATMLAPMLAFMAIHAIESNLVSPWYVGRRLTLSPVAVFLSVMFWAWLWGVAGAILAVPALVALRSICKRNRRLRLLCAYLEGSFRPTPSLRSLLRPRRVAAGLPTKRRGS